MPNNFVNFELPRFQDKYGTDWDDYVSIRQEFLDHIALKIWQIYHLNNVGTMGEKAMEFLLQSLRIEFDSTDTFLTKKIKLRTFVSRYQRKSLEDVYLDIQEEIVGTRGTIYSGHSVGVWRHEYSRRFGAETPVQQAEHIRHSSSGSQFETYIDVQTSDATKLDQITALYRIPSIRPAFYQIYLVNGNFTVLRTV